MIHRRLLLSVLTSASLLTTVACHTATRVARVEPAEDMAKPAADTAKPAADTAKPAAGSAEAAVPGAATAETYQNTIKWSTASEVDNFGFDVFRGDSEDGPFERLNAETIEGGGTVDEPRKYQFVDDTIDPHRTYYYYVESISMGGVRERFTPVGKAGPKIKPVEIDAEKPAGEEPDARDEPGEG